MNLKILNISSYIYNVFQIFYKKEFRGWGRKRSGKFALWCHERFGGSLMLLEDGFIRSLGLGVDGSPSFSLVEDNVGIYYDATAPSRLENTLNEYDFASDTKLMDEAREAIGLIQKHHISKYNNTPETSEELFASQDERRVLIIAQTAGDASLNYGMVDDYTTDDMIAAATIENPHAKVYVKVHPDVLSGKKKSDIDIRELDERVQIITQNVNPISLLKHFEKVYTKTSGMGFEALLVGCECVCFGMPFYAGWGVTDDRSTCQRREAKRSVEEIFAAAYILYTQYHNPYTNRPSDILDTIHGIIRQRGKL
ncbi:MAG: hypothetical protein AUK54_01975 [Helicobacteraceae bacterium CG2_30_36_10]|nr:MAG: hypothetical protein AUK54_01975 [Helicobacteraceae bacterium CG2_30_36_10]